MFRLELQLPQNERLAMQFEDIFLAWLDESLAEPIPASVVAFSFNLFQPAFVENVKFGIELIGAGNFDENDPDWPCDEVWEASVRGINVPVEFSGEDWEECLSIMKRLVLQYVESNSPAGRRLLDSSGIAIGFVDGDLEVIWKS